MRAIARWSDEDGSTHPVSGLDVARAALTKAADDEAAARWVAADERARLRRITLACIREAGMSEAEAARLAGVARTTVRAWRRGY